MLLDIILDNVPHLDKPLTLQEYVDLYILLADLDSRALFY